MHRTEIRPAVLGDAALMGPQLIPEDVENAAAVGMTPETALFESIKHSEKALVVLIDEEPVSMLGLSHSDSVAFFWIATSVAVHRAPLAYTRVVGKAFASICEGEHSLSSVVDVRHKLAIRLSRRFGFKASAPFQAGDGRQFHLLRWERPQCA